MTDPNPIEAQVVPETQALAVRPSQEVGLFGTSDPGIVIDRAKIVAQALKDVIVKQGLVSKIQGKEYPRCEAWTLLGTMIGVFPVLCWSKPVEGGWEARVEARTKDGAVVGAAEAQCLRAERNWSNRDDFALRSMAQTRATAKCLRMPLGFVMSLSGFEVTPAEEMVSDHPNKPEPKKPAKPASKTTTGPAYKLPTEATRKWMVDEITGEGLTDIAREYFQKVEGRDLLLPNEGLSDLPLPYVPWSKPEMAMLITRIKQFANGERAERAFEPHWDAEINTAKPAADSLPKGNPPAEEWWRSIIVPIPRKGQKLSDYVGNEDTIGSLFDQRHGNDEESQAARQRLWGMVEFRSDADNLTDKDGKRRVPTDTDREFAKALQAFKKWFEENHRGEKL